MKTPATWPNLVTMFFDQAERRGSNPFLWRKSEGAWRSISWVDAAQAVASLAASLKAIGIQPGDRVVLVSENRPEWCIADLGIMAAGAITVPTYTTNTERDHVHILENSGARAAIVSTAKLAKVLLPAVYQSTACTAVIGMEPLRIGQSSSAAIHEWDKLLAENPGDVAATRKAVAKLKRSDTACLIYTSGTGGAPRGVKQHHGAILMNCDGCLDIIENDFEKDEPESFLSFLPASHAYEHSGGQYLPIALGGDIYYAESLEKLAANIEETKPTIMVVVPRLFEVLRQRMLKTIEKQGGLAPKLLDQALKLGRKRYDNGHKLGLLDKPLDLVIDATLRKKVRGKFGGRLKAMVAGGAPLNPEVGIFFYSLGINLLQGYGQTESGPVVSCNRPSANIKMHSVGRPLKGVEVRIAADGEICVRGELVMQGYWQNEEESARVLQDGWLHTGDIGHIDEDGHIVITDRKKDIIVNDKGDNVAPQRVEGMLTLQSEILQAMVHGDRRPYLVGLIVPDPEWVAEWAAENGRANDAALRADPAFHKAVMAAVDRVNTQLSVIEKVRRVILADEAFTVENEMMTPSLKIRRHVIRQAYGAKLDALYG
ncbi:AMP-dependent synthetase/ligase [Sphingoaurantiacus capsulatus]|uniref:AMP-dependent synthetase/ligase n=1 Tax=Sphingoaurantiacus capsulatus TaxID=1771310 RepID=A0ABV7X8U8_9SPHN